jgi:iron complex outermembrane receptor protein
MGDDANGNPLYYKNQTDNYRQTHYQLILLQRLSSNLNLNAALHYTKGKGYYEEYKIGRTLEEYGLTADVEKDDLVRQKWLDNDFYGGVFSFDYTRGSWNISLGGGVNQYAGNHFGKVIWTKETDNLNHEYYRSKADKTDANIYLKGNYKISENLSLYGDLQYRFIDYNAKGLHDTWDWINGKMQDIHIDEQFGFFNPKMGAFYQIDAQNSAYASFAVAHREPNRNNYTENISEKPRSEQLFDYELGYKFSNRIFSAGLNLYYMQYTDQLTLNGKVNEIGEPLTSNVPDSYRTGIELLAGIQITRELKWEGNLTWSCNRIKNYTEYVLTDDGYAPQQEDYYGNTPIAYSPDIIANSLLSYQKNGFRVALQSAYVSKQYLDNTGRNDRMIDAYCVSNLRLGYNFKKPDISVDLLINNFFDEEYETNGWVWAAYYSDGQGGLSPYTEKSYFPQAGTNFMAKVGIKF